MQTPRQVADEAMNAFTFAHPDIYDESSDVVEADYYYIRDQVEAAIATDREQRSDMERFGSFVYELMNGAEWSSDTLQSIGDYAAFALKKPFTDPWEDWATKTLGEIARYTFGKMHSQAAEACENEILAHIEFAIETDRAQRAKEEGRRDRARRIAFNRGCQAFEPDICDVCAEAAREAGCSA